MNRQPIFPTGLFSGNLDRSERTAAGNPPLAYLQRYRMLVNGLVAGASLEDLALLAAAALHALLGRAANVLVVTKVGAEAEILASLGSSVGLLAGRLPLTAFPLIDALLQSDDPFVVRHADSRHPLFPNQTAVLALIAGGAGNVGAMEAWLPQDERLPDPQILKSCATELARILAATFPNAARLEEASLPGITARDHHRVGNQQPLPAPEIVHHTTGTSLGAAAADDPGLLRAIFDALPYNATFVGTDGQLLLHNVAALAALQHENELTAPTTNDRSPRPPQPDGPAYLMPPLDLPGRGRSDAQMYDARLRYRRHNAEGERWLATTAVPVHGPSGVLFGTLALERDITVQVEAEEARDWLLTQSQAQRELLDRLIESAPVSILLLDPDLRVRLANRHFMSVLPLHHRTRGVLGRTIHEIVPAPSALWHAETVVEVLTQGVGVLRPEVRLVVNGEEALWEVAATPLRDATGIITGVLFCAHDVTARVQVARAEELLLAEVSAEHERFRAILDLIPGGVVAMDADASRFLYVNQTALAMATQAGATAGGPVRAPDGRPFWELLPHDGHLMADRDVLFRPAAGELGTIASKEFQVKQADGSLIPVVLSATPLPTGPDGTPGGTVIVFVDITLLKEVERIKDDFLAIASHDLRSPLSVILARVQLLRKSHADGSATPDSTNRALTTIFEYVQQLTDLATSLLDVTLMHSGRFQVRRARVDLAAVARRVAEPLVSAAPSHKLHFVAPAEGLFGHWEEARIAQVIQNLVQNAVKYSPNGGLIRVEVQPVAERGVPWALLRVTDQGIGISPEERARIFDRFTRGDAARQRGLGGTGLGLHICHGIVRAHGGTIAVDGTPEGGSVFTVRLPLEGLPES